MIPFHTSKPGGLGLGLAICRSIVEAHGGSISLENNPDRGATSRVTLKIFREPAAHMSLPTVHLVDDDPSLLRALSRLLSLPDMRCGLSPSATDFLAGHAAARSRLRRGGSCKCRT